MLVTLVILGLLVAAVIFMYNSLVRLRVSCENAWSDINVQLKRRHDLIPNLVETVKGYAKHEQETFEKVIQARNQAMSAQGPAATAEAEKGLSGMLRSLFALAESYPELRASENFAGLQNTLSEIEGAIQNARRYYNAVVRDFNTKVQQIPWNIVASFGNFQEREFFEIDEVETRVPEINFTGDQA